MKDIRSIEQSLFSIHNPEGVKFLSRLRLNISHLTNTNLNIILNSVDAD